LISIAVQKQEMQLEMQMLQLKSAHTLSAEVWIIGPVSFRVFNNLTNDSLLAAKGYIRKISKMLKKPAHLGGAAQVVAGGGPECGPPASRTHGVNAPHTASTHSGR
jgi:hypothetical protein